MPSGYGPSPRADSEGAKFSARNAGLLQKYFGDLVTRPPGNIPGFDVLRTVAILLVFSAHFSGEFGISSRVAQLPIFYFGWTGVDLFFVLSGFLIGLQLWKELERTGRIDVPQFLLRRGLRIWPLYYSFVGFIAVEGLLFHRNLSGIWADASLTSNYFHGQVGGGWSLSTEEQFYILFPVALVLVSWLLRVRQMWLVPVTALAVVTISRVLTIQNFGNTARPRMYFPIHTHSDGLAIGALLAWAYVLRPDIMRGRIGQRVIAPIMLVSGIGVHAASAVVFNYLALALIYGAFAIWAVNLSRIAFLEMRGFYLVSRLSYCVYLNHFGLIPLVLHYLAPLRTMGMWGFGSAYVITFGICVLFSAATFVLIEQPFLQLRTRFLSSRSPSSVQLLPKAQPLPTFDSYPPIAPDIK
jgi:peptidoglycan/LPS O-acetylase OafA/YrhL